MGKKNPEIRKTHPNLIRIGVFSIEKVLPFVKSRKYREARPVKTYAGKPVYMDSLRYHTFLNSGLVCVGCGLTATFFALETTQFNAENSDHFHFNLYGIDEEGDEVLFTKDHIFPKSRGGKNHISNLQTMCAVCNTKKGSKI